MIIKTGDEVAEFVGNSLGFGVSPPWTAMGLEKDGLIVAGVIFHCFEGFNVHLTVAGHGWTRGFFREVGVYVFDTLNCERMTFTTENPSVARLGEKLGGQIEGLMRNQFGRGRDGYLIGVLKDEYRFK